MPSALTPQQLVSGLFRGTYKKMRDAPLGRYAGSALAWLAENKPDILAAAEAADAAVDAAAAEFLAGRADETSFRTAGRAWYAAWMACGEALPETAPDAPPPAPAPAPPTFVPLPPLAPGQVRDFKDLGVAVHFVGEAQGFVDPARSTKKEAIDFWLVGEYTGRTDRTELSVADLDRLAAIKDTFPGSAFAALQSLARTATPAAAP
jgi:hypothetical protein